MKAMVLTGIRQIELRDVPDPAIRNDTDVLLKMGAIGVCGSDIHYYTTGRIGSQVVKYPFIVGHECAGTVLKVGAAVRRVKPGDRIAVEPAMPCWGCDQCRAGRPHTCRKLKFLGTPGQGDGCLSDLLVMPETSCFPIHASTTLEQAALSEPFSIGLYAAKLGVMPPNATVAILGAGPIGLSVLAAARQLGAGRVYMTDRIDRRVAVAKTAGADWAANPDRTDAVADILRAEPLQIDVVYECCGQQDAMDQGVELLKPGGRLVLVGIPEVDRIAFSIDKLRRKEIVVQNVRRQNHCVQPALDLIESAKVRLDYMITHRFPLERTKEAFDLVAAYGDGVVKAFITW